MKRAITSVVLICFVISFTLFASNPQPAAALALSARISNLTCSSVTVTGTSSTNATMLTIDVFNLNTGAELGFFQGGVGSEQGYSHSFSFGGTGPGDIVQAQVSDSIGNTSFPQATVAPGCAATSSGGGAGTTFSPGDGRIEPRAGDRVAVYCNINKTGVSAGMLGIYGILDDGTGVFLAEIKYVDLVAAGGTGITRSVEPNGTVVVWVSNKTQFYVKWFGGPADATGMGDFRKRFSCTFGL